MGFWEALDAVRRDIDILGDLYQKELLGLSSANMAKALDIKRLKAAGDALYQLIPVSLDGTPRNDDEQAAMNAWREAKNAK